LFYGSHAKTDIKTAHFRQQTCYYANTFQRQMPVVESI